MSSKLFLLASRIRPNPRVLFFKTKLTRWFSRCARAPAHPQANFVGTEFRVYDNGSNPDDIDNDDDDAAAGASSEARQELGVVLYESNVMGARGPRKMQVPRGVA